MFKTSFIALLLMGLSPNAFASFHRCFQPVGGGDVISVAFDTNVSTGITHVVFEPKNGPLK